MTSSTENKPYRAVSMFSGCGGMDLGFLGDFEFLGKYYTKNPFEIIWANDSNKAACLTYRNNFDHDIYASNIWDVIHTLPPRGSVDIVMGGFPCQDISVNGKGRGINGARSGLYRAMVDAVDRLKPNIFVAENVKGLLMRHNRTSLETVLRDFARLGYKTTYHLYHAADFGVPQSRERVFIVGTAPNVDTFKPPKSTHKSTNWINAETAISDLEQIPETPEINHVWSKAKKSPDQGNRRLKAERVAYTIRAECHGNIQYHYSMGRRISMREAARIQSFPDKFIFHAKLRETERQIGNAVPPILAWHIAQSVKKALQHSNTYQHT